MEEKTINLMAEVIAAGEADAANMCKTDVGCLQYALHNLEHCSTLAITCRCSLSMDDYDVIPGMWAYDDERTIRSEPRAKQLAQARIDRAFVEAQNIYERYICSTGDHSFYKSYCENLSSCIEQMERALDRLQNEKNASIIEKMRCYANKSSVLDKAREVCDNLYSRYSPTSPKDYYSRIEYSKDERSDSGDRLLYRMVAKAFTQYGYNCMGAIHTIQEDIDHNMAKFDSDFNDQMKRFVLGNVVEPIRQLSAKL